MTLDCSGVGTALHQKRVTAIWLGSLSPSRSVTCPGRIGEVLVSEARRWIGNYLVQLNGVDALVFTAGIGENRGELRAAICAQLDQLGIELDPAVNAATRATETIISAATSRVKVMVIPTNEELVVARESRRLLQTAG